jgi:hypothetical protein
MIINNNNILTIKWHQLVAFLSHILSKTMKGVRVKRKTEKQGHHLIDTLTKRSL